ncbi:MAG: methyltransferase domain-containing protein [Patescibacteria group bacterium]
MQTPAEKYLVKRLAEFLKKDELKRVVAPRILNIGADKSLSIENQLTASGSNYICDRIDISDCGVDYFAVDKCWKCSVEEMSPVSSEYYFAAFANYVLEHVLVLDKAAREIYRVLKPGGVFITSTSNPTAPEFVLARWTPLWFHKKIRSGESWETHYAYKNIEELINIFEDAGLRMIEIRRYPFVEGYLARFFLLNILGKFYDKIISILKVKRFMGNACIVFEKNK